MLGMPGGDEMTRRFAAAAALTLGAFACAHAGGTTTAEPAPAPPTATSPASSAGAQPSDARTVAAFNERLKSYQELHDKLERTLPPLPTEADPKVIDKHQRAMEALLKQHRSAARRGDLFAPDMERLIRRLFAQIFKGTEGAKLKATIMDENPTSIKLAVNGRYPDEVPLSTMPPQVLAMLPKLPEELEYRFIGHRLILLDVHSHTVADYIENALP
jgi:hypothetical protein